MLERDRLYISRLSSISDVPTFFLELKLLGQIQKESIFLGYWKFFRYGKLCLKSTVRQVRILVSISLSILYITKWLYLTLRVRIFTFCHKLLFINEENKIFALK